MPNLLVLLEPGWMQWMLVVCVFFFDESEALYYNSVTLTRFNMILIEFTQCYIKFNWFYIEMYQIWLERYWIELDLIYLFEFGTFFFESILVSAMFGLLDVVRILYRHMMFYQFHQIPLLCDHRELACTPKDPPRRFDMNEMGLIFFYEKIHWVINKTVWKPILDEL